MVTRGKALVTHDIVTSVWCRSRLHDVLHRCNVMGVVVDATNMCFEGAEDLPGGGDCKYDTSLRRISDLGLFAINQQAS
jgi:hypothetical protein